MKPDKYESGSWHCGFLKNMQKKNNSAKWLDTHQIHRTYHFLTSFVLFYNHNTNT